MCPGGGGGGGARKSTFLTAFSGDFGPLGGVTHFPGSRQAYMECFEGGRGVFSGVPPGGHLQYSTSQTQNPENRDFSPTTYREPGKSSRAGPGRAGWSREIPTLPRTGPAAGLAWAGLAWAGLGRAGPAGQILRKVHPRPRAGKIKKNIFQIFKKSENPKKIFFVQKNHFFKNPRKNYFSDFLRSGFHFLGFRAPGRPAPSTLLRPNRFCP